MLTKLVYIIYEFGLSIKMIWCYFLWRKMNIYWSFRRPTCVVVVSKLMGTSLFIGTHTCSGCKCRHLFTNTCICHCSPVISYNILLTYTSRLQIFNAKDNINNNDIYTCKSLRNIRFVILYLTAWLLLLTKVLLCGFFLIIEMGKLKQNYMDK